MNRSRTNQLLKIEKEYENKDIKTKYRTLQSRGASSHTTDYADKHSQPFGRSSGKFWRKAKSANSVNNESQTSHQTFKRNQATSIVNLPTERNNESTDIFVESLDIFPNHVRLSPYMAPTPGPKPRLGSKQLRRTEKMTYLPALKEKKYHEEKKSLAAGANKARASLLELLTPLEVFNAEDSSNDSKKPHCNFRVLSSTSRPVSSRLNSPRKKIQSARLERISPKFLSDRPSTCSETSAYLNLDLDLYSLDTKSCDSEVFYMASSIPVPRSTNSAESSGSLEQKFRDVLDVSRSSMIDEDIKAVKDVLKTNEHHSVLKSIDADPQLFKHALKAQLQEIIKNEKVIKTALKKLRTPKENHNISPREKIEMTDLISMRSKTQSSTKKHTNFEVNAMEVDDKCTERVRQSIFEEANTQGHKPKSYLEKRYAYYHKDSGKTKDGHSQSEEAPKEYEKFLQCTLPLKQRVHSKQIASTKSHMHNPDHVDLELNVIGTSEDDSPKSYDIDKPQVNVTFKNVASLEKEVLILRALGDRLEASLKRTTSDSYPSNLDKIQDIKSVSSMTSLTKEICKIDSSIQVFAGRCTSDQSFEIMRVTTAIPWQEQWVGYEVYAKGLCLFIGIVEEYMIVSKTIDELRCEGCKSFYISKSGHFERTCFEKLKTEPQVLLQNIKPKIAGNQFNLLDHDSMFFNSFLKPIIKNETTEKPKTEIQTRQSVPTKNTIKIEGGDSKITNDTAELTKKTQNTGHKTSVKLARSIHKKSSAATVMNKNEFQKLREYPMPMTSLSKDKYSGHSISTRCSRIRRVVTPMPFDAFDEPKNNLVKKVLIGVIQASIFMGLIMALTLPDIKC